MARWIPCGWQFVEPLKEAQASVMLTGAGLTSIARVLSELGLDLEDIIKEWKRESQLFVEAGIELSMDQPKSAPAADSGDDPAEADEDAHPRVGEAAR